MPLYGMEDVRMDLGQLAQMLSEQNKPNLPLWDSQEQKIAEMQEFVSKYGRKRFEPGDLVQGIAGERSCSLFNKPGELPAMVVECFEEPLSTFSEFFPNLTHEDMHGSSMWEPDILLLTGNSDGRFRIYLYSSALLEPWNG